MATVQLKTNNVSKYFGGVAAVSRVSLAINKGEIRGLIGPNGAGKTTLFNVISGFYAPNDGTIEFEGHSIEGMTANKIARLGLVRTFQRDAIFHDLTTCENVSVSRQLRVKEGPLRSIFGNHSKIYAEQRKKAKDILDFVGIGELENEFATNLPHGHQRMLGVAIALAAEPKVLMLDEPVTGMTPTETEQMTDLIRRIHDECDITILLVEHNMNTVMSLCNYISVLDFGEVLTEGVPEEIRENEQVIEAYLGAEEIAT